MKKLLFVLLIVPMLFSCNKEWTCTCTSDSTGEITNISNYDLSESDAESACSNQDNQSDISCSLERD